jgi:hypothetical protein
VGTSSNNGANLTLAFSIPRGVDGTNGTNGITPAFSASASTLSAGSSATVTATSSNGGANIALAFGIPAGAAGGGGNSNLTLSDATPSNLGTASAGTSNLAARADHTHNLPVIAYGNLSGVPANFPTNTTLVSGLNSSYSGINHAHNYVTSLNNLTGGLTLAAGGNVTITSANSTLTIAAIGGLGADDAVDGGTYQGYIPQNTITITQQPTAQTASNGAANFSVSATSTPGGTLSYQWQKQDGGFGDYVDVANATAATLSLTGLLNTVDDADRYRVVVSSTNAVNATSSSVLLTVPANTITITTQPTSQTASSGAATFTAAATVSPSGTPSYQWQRSNDAGVTFANVSGATSATLSLSGLTAEADGGARFRVVVSATNAANVTSNAATLTVESNNTITITQQPTAQTAAGGEATFSVAATSSPAGTPTYQWQRSDLVPTSGVSWEPYQLPASQNWNNVAYGNGLFLVVPFGGTTVATSADGLSWTQRTRPNQTTYGLAFGGGRFVSVGFGGSSLRTEDGVTWASSQLPSTLTWESIAYGNGVFVAVNGEAGSATSTDGTIWTARTLPISSGRISYANGIFFALGSTSVATSTDGVSWTQRTLPANASWTSVAFGSNIFVAVSENSGIAATSVDGVSWTQRSLPVSGSAVVHANGVFVAGGFYSVATSVNGIDWVTRLGGVSMRDIAFGGGRFVIASWYTDSAYVSSPSQAAFSPISGATSASLLLQSLTSENNSDRYRAVVSAANATSVTSQSATLTVTG